MEQQDPQPAWPTNLSLLEILHLQNVRAELQNQLAVYHKGPAYMWAMAHASGILPQGPDERDIDKMRPRLLEHASCLKAILDQTDPQKLKYSWAGKVMTPRSRFDELTFNDANEIIIISKIVLQCPFEGRDAMQPILGTMWHSLQHPFSVEVSLAR